MSLPKFVRTKGGKTLHRATCRYVTNTNYTTSAKYWDWAEGKTRDELQDAAAHFYIRPCRACKPLQ